MKELLNDIVATLEGITKRLSALEKAQKTNKTNAKNSTKKTAKKDEVFYDITLKGKVNRRDLESLENSYNHNLERYGKKFKESFKTFNDFKKSLNDLGSIKTRDRVYYSQREYEKLKGATK